MNKDTDEDQHPDIQLFRDICKGQAVAIRELHQQTFPLILGLLKKYQVQRNESWDLMQEGALALIGYCGKSKFILSVPLKQFYYSICYKIWLKKMKKKGRSSVTNADFTEYVNLDAYLNLEEEAKKKAERLQLIHKYLYLLEPKDRTLITAYYLQEKPHEEIASEMGFPSSGAARIAKFRALDKLRKLMRQDPDLN
ncbi:MAG: sigma-70 family RNA polymerase sigma factor [Saprospiraceae bacterium]|nr:sigma-70 family RNA polymerase sigma factor [Saprospiraceae bacterium]